MISFLAILTLQATSQIDVPVDEFQGKFVTHIMCIERNAGKTPRIAFMDIVPGPNNSDIKFGPAGAGNSIFENGRVSSAFYEALPHSHKWDIVFSGLAKSRAATLRLKIDHKSATESVVETTLKVEGSPDSFFGCEFTPWVETGKNK